MFEGGVAGASSVYNSDPSLAPTNAFLTGSHSIWHSGADADGGGTVAVPFPHLIWYRFPAPFRPGQVSFRPRLGAGCDPGFCGATKYQFVGTNDQVCDQYSRWTILCQDLSGEVFKRRSSSKYCLVKDDIREEFTCLGINVLESSFGRQSEVSMNGIRMWKKV